MYASVAKFRFNRPLTPKDYEDNDRVLVPLVKTQPGYRGYLEVRTGERESISITLWDSEADAQQGLASIRQELVDLFGSAMQGPPERSAGHVEYADLA